MVADHGSMDSKTYEIQNIQCVINTFKYHCPSQETEETSKPTRPVENVALTTKGLQGTKHKTVGWDDGGKIGKTIK